MAQVVFVLHVLISIFKAKSLKQPSKDNIEILLCKPAACTHPGAMPKGGQNVGVDILTMSVTDPSLRNVNIRLREDGGVTEVDAGVEIEMGS